jgi:hypothetical protein
MGTAILATAAFAFFFAAVVGQTDDKLTGTWKLVSATSKTPSGENSDPPYGPSPSGILTYTGDGRVSALVSYAGRKPLSFGAETPALQAEQAEAFKTFLAYGGRYTLNGDKVNHHIEISSIQNFVGKDLVRTVKFQGDQIVLTTPPTPVNGKIQIIELIWKRLPAGS